MGGGSLDAQEDGSVALPSLEGEGIIRPSHEILAAPPGQLCESTLIPHVLRTWESQSV